MKYTYRNLLGFGCRYMCCDGFGWVKNFYQGLMSWKK
jgi:hypothetical protein